MMVEYKGFQIPTSTNEIPEFDASKEVTNIELKGEDGATITGSVITSFIEDDDKINENQQIFKNMIDNYFSSLESLNSFVDNLDIEKEFNEGAEALKTLLEENSKKSDEDNNEE
jgi:hypothetical protein